MNAKQQETLHNLKVWEARLNLSRLNYLDPEVKARINDRVRAVGLHRERDTRVGALYIALRRKLAKEGVREEFLVRAKSLAVQHYAGVAYGVSEAGLTGNEVNAFCLVIIMLDMVRDQRKSA